MAINEGTDLHGGSLGILDDATVRRAAIEHLRRMGVNIFSVDVAVSRLSGGRRQAIAVARSVYQKARILLLDEPTAAIGAKESTLILDVIQQLKAQAQMGIIIAHNYAQIFDVCDRINLIEGGAVALADKRESASAPGIGGNL
jgi:ABC-type sugar transport system ATPase subunit